MYLPQLPGSSGAGCLTTRGILCGGGVLRLLTTLITPSMVTTPIPGTSPLILAENRSSLVEPWLATCNHRPTSNSLRPEC